MPSSYQRVSWYFIVKTQAMADAYIIHAITGDKVHAGTDANVYLILHDHKGNSSETIHFDNFFKNDHERGHTSTIKTAGKGVKGPITKIEIWKDNFDSLYINKSSWFLDRMEVVEVGQQLKDIENVDDPVTVHQSAAGEPKWVFPFQRWVRPGHHYLVPLYDIKLPMNDLDIEYRQQEIERKKAEYMYKDSNESIYAQVKDMPSDENFSHDYQKYFKTEKVKLYAQTTWMKWTEKAKWESFDDLKSVYKRSLGVPEVGQCVEIGEVINGSADTSSKVINGSVDTSSEVKCMNVWKEDSWFALQRLQGVNPLLIELCTHIPHNMAVNDVTVEGLLDDLTLYEALMKKKIFICNLQILDEIKCKDNRQLAAPMALFFLNKEEKLMPIAIQLKQKGDHNPVFTPKDSPNTWLMAKMFYNNAEAQHHQALTHLGNTRLLMEGVVVCTHRNLSPSHPIAKLMAPHFLYLIPRNVLAMDELLSEGGWIDSNMTAGVCGVLDIMKRGFDQWTYTKHGSVTSEILARGLLYKDILPYYPYRDDALALYYIIKKYVKTIVNHHYDSNVKLKADYELKNWRLELVKPRNEGGVGLKGIPGSKEGFCNVEEVVDVVTLIISTLSLGHATANFQQYEQYGYIPNYPAILMKDLPKEKKEYTEEEIMQFLPDKRQTLDIMVITKVLSGRGTTSLGDFELQYLYDPVGVKAAQEFRKDLDRLSKQIATLNVDRQYEFKWLDPVHIPHAISV